MPQATTTAPIGNRHENSQTPQPKNPTQAKVLREPPTGKEFFKKLRDGRVLSLQLCRDEDSLQTGLRGHCSCVGVVDEKIVTMLPYGG